MMELHADGRAGAKNGLVGDRGGARRQRAAQIISEYAMEAAPKIKKAFEDGLADKESIGTRQATALHLLAIEREERKLELQEDRQDVDSMNKDQLISSIMSNLTALQQAGAIAEEIIDVTGEEV